jgi:putative transposase
MKYGFIEEHREMYRIGSMCAVLKTSRSGYYAWRNRQPSRRRIDNQELLGHIRQVHTRSRKLYGSPRITAELNEQGFKCGKNRVARIMKDHSICAEVKKRRFRRTTDSRHDYALAANLLM